jgi:1-acyl-sn-glycerol-3-phosphate acyltransferase
MSEGSAQRTSRLPGEVDETVRTGRGPGASALYWFLVRLGRLLTRLYWRIEVVGRDRFPVAGGYVISPVHRSNVDFMLPALACPTRIRWMAKSSIFVGGWIDRWLRAMGAFPVKRDELDRASLATCLAVVADGQPLVMFPEGRRREGPVIEDIFDGPAYVACRERVPIVPIGIGGSDRAMPIGSKMVFPRKVVVVVGEPIYPDVPAEGRVPRADVNAFSDRLKARLQELYDDAKDRAGA